MGDGGCGNAQVRTEAPKLQANVARKTAAVNSNTVRQPEPDSHHATLQSTGGGMTCDMWQKVADKLIGFVADKGCDWMAKLACGAEASVVAIGGCQVLGLGPQDPLSDVCSVAAESAVIWGCSELCNLPVKDATSKLLHKLDGGCGNAQVKMESPKQQANVAHETAGVHSNSVCQPEPNSLHATLQSTGGGMTCDMWQKVADKLVGFVADKGCDWMAKLGCG